jgi:hypothetical protein
MMDGRIKFWSVEVLDGASLMMFTHQMVSTAEEEEEEVAEVDA